MLFWEYISNGEIGLPEESDEEDTCSCNAYFVPDGENVHIIGKNLDL
jgi:hypothetical protein